MSRIGRLFKLGPPAALLGGAGYFAARVRLSIPRTGGKLSMPCLDEEVEVVFDRAGIPHIRAATAGDAYRALGFLMAQDRMVQMHTMLQVARGRLAESVGGMALDMDHFMRTVGLARVAEELTGNLDAESVSCLERFCEGVNAFLSGNRIRLPFEFIPLKGRPEPWRPSDCMTIGLFTMWLLDSFWPADIMREKLMRCLGRERAAELLPETTAYNNPPVKVDGPGVKAETLEPGEDIDWDFEGGGGADWVLAPGAGAVMGSNNWAIGGDHTTTGKPILCADPHIQHNAPGVLYMFHLECPELNAIGAGFPGVPVVVYGHNGYCAWGATSLCPDVQDLYVETFESETSNRYLYEGEWLEAEVIAEEVRVRFSKTRRLDVLVTRHGPIIKRKGDKGLALRWVAHDTSLDSLKAFLRQNRARSWDEFVAAMENYVGPAMNQAYADIDGNIGYMAAAKVPVRAEGDGTVPCDGSKARGEWTGYVPFSEMPRALNPEEGFLATANSKVVSEGYPHLITKCWEAPYRNGRITELLRSKEKFGPEDMAEIHGDTFTFPGRRFAVAAVGAAEASTVKLSVAAARAVDYLRDWDHHARTDSVAMSIYFYSWQHLCESLLRHRLGSTLFREYMCSWSSVNLALENLLEGGEDFWLPPDHRSYDSLVLDSLEKGVAELECVFGTTDQSAWRWGRVHYLTCQHLLGLAWPLDRIFNVGPAPRAGEVDTVNASPPASDCLVQLLGRGTMGGCGDIAILPDCNSHAAYAGPVLRLVVDLSDLDNSRAVLDVGQSGHRLSPHYKDHFDHWLNVRYLPLPYSREKVAEQAASTLTLVP